MPLPVKAEADMPRSVQLRFRRVFGSCAPGTGRRPEDGGGSGADLAHVVVVQVDLGRGTDRAQRHGWPVVVEVAQRVGDLGGGTVRQYPSSWAAAEQKQ
jgi:hypothetical protein